mgnify:CR=1 FL=1
MNIEIKQVTERAKTGSDGKLKKWRTIITTDDKRFNVWDGAVLLQEGNVYEIDFSPPSDPDYPPVITGARRVEAARLEVGESLREGVSSREGLSGRQTALNTATTLIASMIAAGLVKPESPDTISVIVEKLARELERYLLPSPGSQAREKLVMEVAIASKKPVSVLWYEVEKNYPNFRYEDDEDAQYALEAIIALSHAEEDLAKWKKTYLDGKNILGSKKEVLWEARKKWIAETA